SRSFHPDANRHLDPDTFALCTAVAKRVTEGYCVLRDPRKRKAYDAHRESGGGMRMQLAAAAAAHAKTESEKRTGTTPQGKQFFMKAEEDLRRNDTASASRNLQMALTFEPDNELFKAQLKEARDQT
ncbi:MAG: molecular chaperone DnaJ, partial [Gemmatimonadetes bacterium]|nr:molecular chaperone DnaJ [Gemmatimonadota bacterium]